MEEADEEEEVSDMQTSVWAELGAAELGRWPARVQLDELEVVLATL
jgi:hypothetical protein